MSLHWRRSTLCADAGCVEVARRDGVIAVRDSKDPGSGALSYTPAEWAAFIAGVKAGEFDDFAVTD